MANWGYFTLICRVMGPYFFSGFSGPFFVVNVSPPGNPPSNQLTSEFYGCQAGPKEDLSTAEFRGPNGPGFYHRWAF